MILLAHYRLNSDATDSSGNGRHGTASNVSYVPGKVGMAGSFNGSTTYINCNSEFIGTSACTIAAWIYLNGWGEGVGANGYGRVLDNGKTMLYVVQAGDPPAPTKAIRFSSNGSTYADTAQYVIDLGAWYHVVVTRTAAGVANLYINGALSGSANQSSGTPAAGTTNVYLGNRVANDRTFNGFLDDVRIYDEVLSIEKIRAIVADNEGLPYPWQERLFKPVLKPILLGA